MHSPMVSNVFMKFEWDPQKTVGEVALFFCVKKNFKVPSFWQFLADCQKSNSIYEPLIIIICMNFS